MGNDKSRAHEVQERGSPVSEVDSDAAYYQAHKDEAEEWGEPEQGAGGRRPRMGAMVSVRFTPDEVAQLRERAERQSKSLSEFVREAVLGNVQPEVVLAHISRTRIMGEAFVWDPQGSGLERTEPALGRKPEIVLRP